MKTEPAPPLKPKGWLVGLAVALITLGVVLGLAGITLVAKRQQRHRITNTNEIIIRPQDPK